VSRSEALSLFRSGFVSLWVCLALIQSETKSKRDKHTNPERNKNCRNGVRGSGGNPVLLGLGGGSAVVRLGPTLFFRRVALHYHLLGSVNKERPLSVYFARHYVKYRASTDTDLSGLSAIFVENVSSEK